MSQAIFDQDILPVPPKDIHNIRNLAAIVGGRLMYITKAQDASTADRCTGNARAVSSSLGGCRSVQAFLDRGRGDM
jgi:hypothetical protein